MSFLYPRTIRVTREASTLTVTGGRAVAQSSQPGGRMPYVGANQATETEVFAALPASIQGKGGGATTDQLPSGAPGPMRWLIFMPASGPPPGSIKTRDLVYDDLGRKFQVVTDYGHPLGWKLETIQLIA